MLSKIVNAEIGERGESLDEVAGCQFRRRSRDGVSHDRKAENKRYLQVGSRHGLQAFAPDVVSVHAAHDDARNQGAVENAEYTQLQPHHHHQSAAGEEEERHRGEGAIHQYFLPGLEQRQGDYRDDAQVPHPDRQPEVGIEAHRLEDVIEQRLAQQRQKQSCDEAEADDERRDCAEERAPPVPVGELVVVPGDDSVDSETQQRNQHGIEDGQAAPDAIFRGPQVPGIDGYEQEVAAIDQQASQCVDERVSD